MTQETRTTLKGNIDSHIPNNTAGEVSPADVRENMKDTADSAIFPEDPVGQVGASTGWLSGGVISVVTPNVSSTFDLTAGSGIITNSADTTAITHSIVSWGDLTGVSPEFLATNAVSFIAMDETGTIEQSATFPVGDDLRTHIQLGAIIHGDNATISGVSNFVSAVPFQIAPSLTDLAVAIGVVQLSGNVFSGSGNANLKFQKSAGADFYFGINAKIDPSNPNNISNILQNEPNIDFSWRNGSGGFVTTVSDAITAGVYDDGTGGALEPSGNVTQNNWTNARIKYSPDADTIFIEYGDSTYNSSTVAAANVGNDFYGDNPSFAGVPIRGYVSLRGGGYNLDIESDAVFTKTNKFGEV